MIVSTTRFGQIEVDEAQVIRFPDGLYGFEEFKGYTVVEHSRDAPFLWLQSLDDPDLAFVIAEPFAFFPWYEVFMPDDDTGRLELASPEDAAVFVILVIPDNPEDMTANLLAPLVCNVKRGLGRQIILHDRGYSTHERVFPIPASPASVGRPGNPAAGVTGRG